MTWRERTVAVALLLASLAAAQDASAGAATAAASAAASSADVSTFAELWGEGGQAWSPSKQLTDWSFAGYASGFNKIPKYKKAFDVTDFGAQPKKGFDNAGAFQRAIAAACRAAKREGEGQAVVIPPGNWTMKKEVYIDCSNVALRGSGLDKTTVYIPLGLDEVYRSGDGQAAGSGWRGAFAFGYGFFGIAGRNPSSQQMDPVAWVTASVRRGSYRLTLGSTAGIQVGGWYKLAIPQKPRGSSRAAAAGAAAGDAGAIIADAAAPAGLADQLGGLFPGSSELQALAREAAQQAGLLPPSSSSSVSAAAAAASAPSAASASAVSPFMRAAMKHIVSGAASDWYEEQEEQGVVAAAASADVAVATASSSGTALIDRYLYGDGLADSGTPQKLFANNDRLRMPFRVVRKASSWIELDRPLPIDIRTVWKPAVYRYEPTVQHSGFENFTIQFKWDSYQEHQENKGYNGVAVYEAANCWVRRMRIVDCTSGIFAGGTEFVTVKNVEITVTKPRGRGEMRDRGLDGHHALMMSDGAYNLMTRFSLVNTRYFHDISVDALLHLSVFSAGAGADINIDNHRGGTHNNLFTNLDVGAGKRPFQAGGRDDRGAHAGANTTYWGLHASSGQSLGLPSCDHGAYLNFVGNFRKTGSGSNTCPRMRWTVLRVGRRREMGDVAVQSDRPAPTAATAKRLPVDLFKAQRLMRGMDMP